MSKPSKTPLNKEELVERLKAIAADETPRIDNPGAMCYSPIAPQTKHSKCNACGCDIHYYDFHDSEDKPIKKLVKEIAQLGYDVKVSTFCKTCAEKLKKELYPNKKSESEDGFNWETDVRIDEINYVFYFRTSADMEYHRAIANSSYKFMALLTLFQNKPMYSGNYDESHYIADEVDTLEFMTGIKFNV